VRMAPLLWCAVVFPVLAHAQMLTSADAGIPSAGAVPKAQQILDTALADKAPDAYQEALTALGLSRTPKAKDVLLKAIKEPDGKQRFAAARGLYYLADPSTAEAVQDAFRKEDGWAVKKELAMAAVETGAKDLLPELRTATLDPHKELAAAAAWALTDFKDPAGEPALVRLGRPARKNAFKEGSDRWARKVLTGKTEGDAKLAAVTLAQYGKPEDAAVLEKALTSMDPSTRLWAAAGVLRWTGSAK
jgi:HEAT repeat protein